MTDKTDHRAFWENRYAEMSEPTNGKPSSVLERHAAGRTPGLALDIGSARGDDALWLASRGWQVTGVDISQTALDIAARRAEDLALSGAVRFERHTLPDTFPIGRYDLVTALFFHSKQDFDRDRVLDLAGQATAPGGMLIIAAHKTAPPWRTMPDGHDAPVFPSAKDDRNAATRGGGKWREVFVGVNTRTVTGPDSQIAEIEDSHVILERL
ncbi:class I SAM-dependent methyltransferase [Maritimibacter dapengensis]|uniref:Methyltransferase domain-containing protein n=1 Tax=Maritimibacter dapengensis TaxID=2836868 RepID=A0ABS6T0P4_9RHOB|nr:class I SAM-dependent methyltransferase [Maritimibacter dapengensis]MBV7378674.1 methyltransferase domain-containing protein [Maritimibacter dapengensis]